MAELIKKVPIPTAGVALGLAALGNLLQPYSDMARGLCGALSLALVLLLLAKIVRHPDMIRADFKNPILASVSATLLMAIMQLSTYLAPATLWGGFALWAMAIGLHLSLMAWFTARFIRRFQLKEVFPTYFICYVGIIVASATSPTYGAEALGYGLFWFGFACYLVLLGVITYRYAKHEVPEGARPLFCIYTAPMSLSLVGYLATAADPSPLMVAVMLVLAQAFLVLVLARLPKFLALPFYPSYAAMTFPFVITATALSQGVAFLNGLGAGLPLALDVLVLAEMGLAIVMVGYVTVCYLQFFFKRAEQPVAQPAAIEVIAD
ncbi:MAG: TDT family transporter [Eggerthellaceae bacterium]|jgi:exfoliative toxin A/B|nr:TDT family transporter [Eggerthellaceae bacterium]